MRRRLYLFVAAALCGGSCAALAAFTPGPTPTLGGVRAVADLPVGQHKRNVGGSDGAGLCVYTSAWHAAIWQDARELFEFRAWMQRRPGGSYPQKFDSTIKQYCAEKRIPVPPYVQHTGGDVEFLERALKTGRMPCVTYCGVDGPGRYGGSVIAHMVNLCHLDRERAAIVDNNFPGSWLWMTRAEFLSRWRGVREDGRPYVIGRMAVGGGWAIVLLAPPPPPYPDPPAVQVGAACQCGDNCVCTAGQCPATCPVVVGQCPGGVCPTPARPAPLALPLIPAGPTPIGSPPSDRHEWGEIPGCGWGWRFKLQREPQPVGAVGNDFPPGGVDSSKLLAEQRYWHTGVPTSKAAVLAALDLPDDSERWNLAAVGDAAFVARVKADVASLNAELRGKVHVQGYAPDAWQVGQFKLVPGVTLRKPAVGRVGADVGVIPAGEYGAAKLAVLLTLPGGPAPAPVPVPKPVPKPDPPKVEPKPAPVPVPAPSEPACPPWLAALVALACVLISLFRKKKV